MMLGMRWAQNEMEDGDGDGVRKRRKETENKKWGYCPGEVWGSRFWVDGWMEGWMGCFWCSPVGMWLQYYKTVS